MHTLHLQSDTKSLAQIEPFLASVVQSYVMDETRYHNAVIALTEAVNNAIVHGNRRDASKQAVVTADIQNGNLIMTVQDEGEGFDINALPDPLHPDNLLREGGRGVFLIQALTDFCEFTSTGLGSLITMRMKLRDSSL